MSASEVRKQIRRIRNNSLNMRLSCLEEQLVELFEGYTHTPFLLSQSSPFTNQWRFHRSIKYSKRPDEIKELSYPPVARARLSRANHEGTQIFYCSGDPRSTLFELGLTAGDRMVLSKWLLTGELLISPLGYTKESFEKLKSNRDCPIIIPAHARPRDTSKLGNILIEKFLSEEFTRIAQGDKIGFYHLTALISRLFLTLRPECGLVYPTIAMRANAENFALTPLAVDNNLQIQEAHWLEITNVGEFEYTIKPLFYANSFIDGKIEWNIHNEEQKRYLGGSFSGRLHFD